MAFGKLNNLVNHKILGQGNQVRASYLKQALDILAAVQKMPYASCKKITPFFYEIAFNDIDYAFGKDYMADYKSTIVAAINELFDAIETEELVVSMAQSNAARKVIFDLIQLHPQLAKNIVFLNGDDNLYYKTNGYKVASDLLTLHTIMPDTQGLRGITMTIAANGSIAVI